MSVENELERLMHAFLATVSFEPGERPDLRRDLDAVRPRPGRLRMSSMAWDDER
jgi:hypothetical protein